MNSGVPIGFKWEWNINTVAVLVGFVAGFIAWGYTLAELRNGREQDAANIERLTKENAAFDQRLALVDRELAKGDQTEYRMAQLEKSQDNVDTRLNRISESYTNQFADFRTQLSAISTQLALTNQTLQRIDVRNGEPSPATKQ